MPISQFEQQSALAVIAQEIPDTVVIASSPYSLTIINEEHSHAVEILSRIRSYGWSKTVFRKGHFMPVWFINVQYNL